ncbi:B12-binding domain-containing protein [Thermaurantiacus tibetensis]|uniref:cobalamin B12-binding domain-containing protein n=1 Tax=Thermaurantiacus tibetensis TaxID=2759035 RepID=UPI00188F76B0|nr:cobalamin-dependent protein [Thermaurantiacus tibetensis]
MTTVGISLALSLEGLLQRFPTLRDFGLRRLRRTHGEIQPANLATIIESEIIPRLLVTHLADAAAAASPARDPQAIAGGTAARGGDAGDATAAVEPIAAEEVARFALAAIDRDVVDLLADVESVLARGVPAGAVLVDLLAPAARELGSLWERDRCDFVDVTMGLWRLQELTHEIAGRLMTRARATAGRRRALFAALPGDDHRFGALLVTEYFRASGWDACCCLDSERDTLCADVAATAYDLVGLTVTQDRQVEMLPDLIEALRDASRNPALLVMVGGVLLAERPELAFLVGADATAPDARAAVAKAEALVGAGNFAAGAGTA